ncbi:MAG TPA: hypothetical protein DER02_03430 [Gammaproteobacteria bacterium]|nr:hypothetical protein [Gammaproteobacteria bacterium]
MLVQALLDLINVEHRARRDLAKGGIIPLLAGRQRMPEPTARDSQDNQPDSSPRRGLASASNQCFVCGPGNPAGLGVRFRLDGDVCRAEFTPQSEHMGYTDVTHGGIIFALLDDVMANWLWLRGDQAVTARADIRYRAELPVGTAITLEGRCLKQRGRLMEMQGLLIRQDTGAVVAEASGRFMLRA